MTVGPGVVRCSNAAGVYQCLILKKLRGGSYIIWNRYNEGGDKAGLEFISDSLPILNFFENMEGSA